jgi:uncharacterized FlaG/YvyC family protein
MSFVAVAIGGYSAWQTYQQGQTDRAMGHLQGKALDYQAEQEKQAAIEQATLVRRAGREANASATSAFAGAGVKVGEGSADEVVRQIGIDSAHDVYQTILNGDRRANALRAGASQSRTQGDLAASNANAKAVGTVLSSGYGAMRANGWATAGPGFSGTQAPAPVEIRNPYPKG